MNDEKSNVHACTLAYVLDRKKNIYEYIGPLQSWDKYRNKYRGIGSMNDEWNEQKMLGQRQQQQQKEEEEEENTGKTKHHHLLTIHTS